MKAASFILFITLLFTISFMMDDTLRGVSGRWFKKMPPSHVATKTHLFFRVLSQLFLGGSEGRGAVIEKSRTVLQKRAKEVFLMKELNTRRCVM